MKDCILTYIDAEGGPTRYDNVVYYLCAHADVDVSLVMEDTTTASATDIAKFRDYC